jgi:hypothetical protein
MCPEGRARKSLAIYYVSDPRPEATARYKASYQARPTDPIRQDAGMWELATTLYFSLPRRETEAGAGVLTMLRLIACRHEGLPTAVRDKKSQASGAS